LTTQPSKTRLDARFRKYKERWNILVCGTMSSGSSALHNLLKEYDNIAYLAHEFDDYRAPGLVADQLSYDSSIDFPNKIDEITRHTSLVRRLFFLGIIRRFLSNLISTKCLEIEYNNRILREVRNKLIRLNQFHLLSQLNEILKTNLSFEEKISITNRWIQDIGNAFSLEKDYTLFDQPLLITSDIPIWTAVFNPYKLMIVYRNPRDQIADIIRRAQLFALYGSPYMTLAGDNLEAIYGKNRKSALRIQIDAIKNRLKWIDSLENVLDPDHFLALDFEGLVNNYDDYKSKVEDFIGGIKGHHKFEHKYFDPSLSKGNIGIDKKYLTENDLRGLSDLEDWYDKKAGNQKAEENMTLKHRW
jgi:hypothetical protein